MSWIPSLNGITGVEAELMLRTSGRIKDRKLRGKSSCEPSILNTIDVNIKTYLSTVLEERSEGAAVDFFLNCYLPV